MRARFGFRREFAAVVGTMLLGFCVCQSPAQAASTSKPNVVFLLADQWRAKATGYEGDPNVKTPNLDRLARQSLNFRNVVSVCPVCTPYRAALMTGRFPTSTGMFLNDVYLPDGELCFAEIFGQAGYATAYIGKWHLDGHGRSEFVAPERRQGWDYWKAAECDHHYPRSHYYEGDSPEKQFWDGYDAFAQTQDAQSYLRRQAQADRPFVLMVSYGTPHFPHHTAPQEYKDLYPLDKIQLSPNVPPELQDTARREAQGYYAHCTALDKCVGDVLATLDETGLAPRTILVFTSDHGEMLGSHGKRPSMKQVPWDEAARVPFLLRYPAAHGPQGRDVPTPLTTPDILPTLLGLADVPLPDTLQGEDLSGLVRGQTEAADRAALYMSRGSFCRPGLQHRISRHPHPPLYLREELGRDHGCCLTTSRIPTSWTIWSIGRNSPRCSMISTPGCRLNCRPSATTSSRPSTTSKPGATKSPRTAACPTLRGPGCNRPAAPPTSSNLDCGG
jgi:arylsulfatase A-like enzyme